MALRSLFVVCFVGFFCRLASALQSRCRCLPGDPCWDLVDWSALNNSVSGRLTRSTDVMQACVSDPASAMCTVALNKSDDEFWLSGQPNGFQHTGQNAYVLPAKFICSAHEPYWMNAPIYRTVWSMEYQHRLLRLLRACRD